MKPTKVHCLAVLAAISITALLGASSAAAESTSLCDVDLGPGPATVCPPNHFVQVIHEVNLSGSKEQMKIGPFFNIECDVLFQGQTVLPLDNPQHGVGTFTYTNCSNGCTVSQVGGAAFSQLKEGHEKAKVEFGFTVRVACMAFICNYIGGVVTGTRWGPLLSLEVNGELSIEKQTLFAQNPDLCPPMGFLTLRTTPLTKLYVTR